jgi:protease-4
MGRKVLVLLLGLSPLLQVSAVAAQLHRATSPVMTPASVLVLRDDAQAIDVNPASIGFLPTWSVALLHSEVAEADSWLGRGDAFSFATPLLFGFSFGGTLQSIRPDDEAAHALFSGPADRAQAGLALAFAPSRRASLGVSSRYIMSGDPGLDGLSAVDIGFSWQAASTLGLSFVARDLFATRDGFGTRELGLVASAVATAQLRPFGTSDFVIDLNAAFDEENRVGGRGGIGVTVPSFGYASAVIEAERIGDADEVLRGMAELSMQLGSLTVAGGGVDGDEVDGLGYYAFLRAEGQARAGVPTRGVIFDLELSGLDERKLLRVVLALQEAQFDSRIAGVLLRPRGSDIGSAYAQELRLAIASLRRAGKRVACQLEDATGAEFYACAAADAVFIDPVASVRLLGASADVLLFGDTLRKVGLRADFVRIGDYKSAPEQFTQNQMSEPARQELQELLTDTHRRVVADLSHDLHVSPERITEIMDDGPQFAADLERTKLVTATLDEAQIKGGQAPLFDDRLIVDELPNRARKDFYAGPRIGVVVIDGAIVDGESVDIPFFDVHMTGGRTAVEAIDAMVADPLVRAIVLRIDSPGGAVLASDQIWRAVRRAREHKPVIASMGAMAASGGYYVAAAADEIWADPSTLTGSIGIFYGKFDVAVLADKLGIQVESFKRGRRAGAESLWRPFTPEERAALATRLRTYYQIFLERVAEGRRKTVAEIDRLARGRVYSGDAAQRIGLVDRLGGFGSALARARELGRVPDRGEVIVIPKRRDSLLDLVLGPSASASARESSPAALLPSELRAVIGRVVAMEQLGATTPLALLPYDVEL